MDKRRQIVPRETDLEELPVIVHEPPAQPASEDRLLALSLSLWNGRRFILRVSIIAAILTAIFSLFLHNTYRSSTRIMPPEKQGASGMAALAGLALGMKGGSGSGSDIGMMAGDLLNSQGTGAVFMGILRSRTLQDKIIDKFDLQLRYGHPNLRMRALREDARKVLEQNTEVDEDRKSGIITVGVTDRDPQMAAAIAAAYVNELNALVSTLSTSAAGRERVFLEGELVKVKKELDDADHQLSEFASKNTTLDPTGQGKAMVEAAANLEGELIAAQSELRGLQSIYTDNNIRVRSLKARIAELRKQLQNQAGGGIGDSSAGDEGTNSELGFPSIRQLPLLGYTYANLYRRARIQETVFGVLTQQYETAKVQEAKEIPTVRTLDLADVPERKYGPHRGILTLVGAFLGIMLASAWVIGQDHWRQRDHQDPYKVLLTDVGQSFRNQRVWRKSEAGLRRVVEISRARMPAVFRNGAGKNGFGNGNNGSNANGSGENGNDH